MTTIDAAAVVFPGKRIGPINDASTKVSGKGTYVRNGYVYASLMGLLVETPLPEHTAPHWSVQSLRSNSAAEFVLQVDDIVLCRVKKITSRHTMVEILAKEMNDDSTSQILLPESLQGLIRKEDVRLSDLDSVEMDKVFHLNQLFRATVRSMGDSRTYFLSIAKPDLGAIHPTIS